MARKDRLLKGTATRLQRALTAGGVPSDIKEYPDAAHGFLNHHDGRVGILIAVLGRLMPLGYNEPAATDARRRIIAFFDQYLQLS